MRLSAKGLKTALRIVCALALVVIGLSHRTPVAAEPPAPTTMAYILPDGTAPVLCLGDSQDHAGHKSPGPGCEVCRLAGSTLLPTPALHAEPPPVRHIAAVWPARAPPDTTRSLYLNAAPRAPPVTSRT